MEKVTKRACPNYPLNTPTKFITISATEEKTNQKDRISCK
jgi:hypothetical protein